MDNTVATVSNEDLQRQLDQQAEQLAKLIKIGTDTALNNQSLLELQKQFGVFIDRYSTNDIKQWEAVGTAQGSVDKLASKIIGGGIVLGIFQTFMVGAIFWALNVLSADHTMLAVHDRLLNDIGAEVQVIRHISGN